MKVKLLVCTPNMLEVMYSAARTCYSEKSPIELWDDSCTTPTDKKISLLEKVLGSGHTSIMEHCSVTFAIEGVDRALTHQLVRHRAGVVFSQQSQRYVEIKENANKLNELLENYKRYNDFTNEQDLRKVVEKYFVIPSEIDYKFLGTDTNDSLVYLADALLSYLILVERGTKAEDARAILPNATKTNIVMTCNLRELSHILSLRRCARAQKPIRELCNEMARILGEKEPWLKPYLEPQCIQLGYCPEGQSCGRKPTLDKVLICAKNGGLYGTSL